MFVFPSNFAFSKDLSISCCCLSPFSCCSCILVAYFNVSHVFFPGRVSITCWIIVRSSISSSTSFLLSGEMRVWFFFGSFYVLTASLPKIPHFCKICKRGRRHKTGAKCAVHKDENCFLCDTTWAQDVCVQRKNVTVVYQAVM